MNVTDFTYLLQHPEKVVSPIQTNQLEDVLEEYPFFQAARALHLKGLKNLNSFKYNNALKLTAAHTADRDVLFDFITSEDFLQNDVASVLSNKSQKSLGALETAPELSVPVQETHRETSEVANTQDEDASVLIAEEEVAPPQDLPTMETGDVDVSTMDETDMAETPPLESDDLVEAPSTILESEVDDAKVSDEEETETAEVPQENDLEVSIEEETETSETPLLESEDLAEVPTPVVAPEVDDVEIAAEEDAETVDTSQPEDEGLALEQVSFSLIGESEDRPLPQSEEDAEKILDPHLFEPRKVLGIGEPIDFKKTEKHSFAQWLQLTSKEVEAEAPKVHERPSTEQEQLKKKKFERIDTFIANNPKIVPKKETVTEINVHEHIIIDPSELMTETLAKVYLEQKKYDQAIQAYTVLSLKYPEKSGFFADRIKAVEQLKKENA